MFRSASSRGFIKRLDFLKQPESQLDLCYNYEFSKKLEACDIHSDLSPQHRSCSYSYLQLAVMAMSQQSLPPVNQYTGSYTEDTDGDEVRLNAFGHEDANIAYDPLSANRRFAGTADLAVLGTLVFAGPTRETISVMVPDCLVPPANDTVRVDLRHHVGLSLGPAADRHAILAVANRDVRVARQNIAELMLYVDDHAAHIANCASAGDDSLTLMSAELIPRLEGGIRAVLDEADNM